MKKKKRNKITVDVSSCKNMNEVNKVIELISSRRVKITVESN